MSKMYFQQKEFNPLINTLDQPIHELMELNMKTLQGFSYFTPVELLKIRKPEEIVEKNIDTLIENGHKTLDYMQQMFHLIEKQWLTMSENVAQNNQKVMRDVQKGTHEEMTEAMTAGKRTVRTMASQLKNNLNEASSLVRKASTVKAKSTTSGGKTTALKAKPTTTSRKTALKSKSTTSSRKITALKAKPTTSSRKTTALKTKSTTSSRKTTALKAKPTTSSRKTIALKTKPTTASRNTSTLKAKSENGRSVSLSKGTTPKSKANPSGVSKVSSITRGI